MEAITSRKEGWCNLKKIVGLSVVIDISVWLRQNRGKIVPRFLLYQQRNQSCEKKIYRKKNERNRNLVCSVEITCFDFKTSCEIMKVKVKVKEILGPLILYAFFLILHLLLFLMQFWCHTYLAYCILQLQLCFFFKIRYCSLVL